MVMIIAEKFDRNKLIAVIFVLFCSFAYLSTQPGLWDKRIQSDDNQSVLPQYFGMFGYHQFENDEIFGNGMSLTPIGHKFAYKISSYFVDVMVAPKIMQIILIYIMIYFAFKIGSCYLGNIGAVFSVIMLLTTEYLQSRVAGALPRGFGSALYFILLYCLLRKSKYGVLLVACLGAFLYPLVTVVSLVCFCIIEIKEIVDRGFQDYFLTSRKILISFAVCMVIIISITVPSKIVNDSKAGEMFSLEEAKANPQFMPGGRIGGARLPFISSLFGNVVRKAQGRRVKYEDPLFFADWSKEKLAERVRVWEGEYSKVKIFIMMLSMKIQNYSAIRDWNVERGNPLGFGLYVIFPLLLFFLGRFRLPEGVIVFVLGSFISCIVAALFAFTFYHPDRYMSYPIIVLISQIFPIGIGYALRGQEIEENRSKSIKIAAILILIFVVKMLYAGPAIKYNSSLNIEVTDQQKGVYNYIKEKVPEDKIIAGVLTEMDAIPVFAKRRVLVSYEAAGALAWQKKCNEEIILPRTEAVCEAYFASSYGPLKRLRDKFGVDYILARKSDFVGDEYPGRLFLPYDDLGKELYHDNKGFFFFVNPPSETVAFEDRTYYLIDLGKLR